DGVGGVELFRRDALGIAATPARVAANTALLSVMRHPDDPPGYEVRMARPVVADGTSTGATVCERSTGAETALTVSVRQAEADGPVCRIDDATFTLGDLFAIERERLLQALGRDAA